MWTGSLCGDSLKIYARMPSCWRHALARLYAQRERERGERDREREREERETEREREKRETERERHTHTHKGGRELRERR